MLNIVLKEEKDSWRTVWQNLEFDVTGAFQFSYYTMISVAVCACVDIYSHRMRACMCVGSNRLRISLSLECGKYLPISPQQSRFKQLSALRVSIK